MGLPRLGTFAYGETYQHCARVHHVCPWLGRGSDRSDSLEGQICGTRETGIYRSALKEGALVVLALEFLTR